MEAEAGGLGFDKLQVTDGIPNVCPQNRITRNGVSGDGGGEAWRTPTRAGVAMKTAVVPPLDLMGHRKARSISAAALPRAQDPTLVLSQQQGAPRSGQ